MKCPLLASLVPPPFLPSSQGHDFDQFAVVMDAYWALLLSVGLNSDIYKSAYVQHQKLAGQY